MIPPVYMVILVSAPLLLALSVFIDGLSRCPRTALVDPSCVQRLRESFRRWWNEPHRCHHKRYHEARWLDADGCPHVTFVCKDCDYRDSGPVYADREGLEGFTST